MDAAFSLDTKERCTACQRQHDSRDLERFAATAVRPDIVGKRERCQHGETGFS